MRKPNWIERCAWIAGILENKIQQHNDLQNPTGLNDLEPKRADPNDPDESLSPAHLLYMAQTLRDKEFDSDTKACRWLGWLQAGMVMHQMLTLESMKVLNLKSGGPNPEHNLLIDSPADVGQGGVTREGQPTGEP